MPKRLASKTRIDRLYFQCLNILERDVSHIQALGIAVKLETGPAKDLRDYIKVLSEIKKVNTEKLAEIKARRVAKANKMSDTELTAKVLSPTK